MKFEDNKSFLIKGIEYCSSDKFDQRNLFNANLKNILLMNIFISF